MRTLFRHLIEGALIALLMLLVFSWGMHQGKREGIKTALSTNPVSEELEMTCLSIWATEQNKKVNPK